MNLYVVTDEEDNILDNGVVSLEQAINEAMSLSAIKGYEYKVYELQYVGKASTPSGPTWTGGVPADVDYDIPF